MSGIDITKKKKPDENLNHIVVFDTPRCLRESKVVIMDYGKDVLIDSERYVDITVINQGFWGYGL